MTRNTRHLPGSAMTGRIERIGRLELGRGMSVVGVAMIAAAVLNTAQSARAQFSAVPVITTRNWKMDVKPDAAAAVAGRNAFEEFVLIEDDQITAFEMSRLGFGPILPTLSAGTNGAINFTVTLTSRNHGSCTWTGSMTATTLNGTLKWTRDGVTYNYTFTGVPYTPPTDVES
jgi:hypothetical protein